MASKTVVYKAFVTEVLMADCLQGINAVLKVAGTGK